MKRKVKMFNTDIDNLTMGETLKLVAYALKEKKQIHHTVINAAKIVAMNTNLGLRQSVNKADLINADGQAVVWASRFLGKPLKERVAGIDLMENVVEMANKAGDKIFLLGATQEVVEKVCSVYAKKYSPDLIAGYRNGYFKVEEEKVIAEQISKCRPQILFVGISSPTKENFLYKNKEILKEVNFIMGVGGSFDVIAGKVKRAPLWMQQIGMEWFYRFLQEPKRMWKRYLVGNVKFVWLVIKERFKS